MWTSIKQRWSDRSDAEASSEELQDDSTSMSELSERSDARIFDLAPGFAKTLYAVGMLHARWWNAYTRTPASRRRSAVLTAIVAIWLVVSERFGVPWF